MRRILLLGLLLIGCTADAVVQDDDDDATDPSECPGIAGQPELQIVSDDESHAPMPDGADLIVERRYQGAIATVIALRWIGVDADEPLGVLRAAITLDSGDVVAERQFDEAYAPCEQHGGVGLHELEVFHAYGGAMPEVDGLPATLEVTAGDLVDRVEGTLRVVGE